MATTPSECEHTQWYFNGTCTECGQPVPPPEGLDNQTFGEKVLGKQTGVITGQVPVTPWPDCPDHKEIQHRDRKPPWCNTCGWNRGRPAISPRQLRE